MALKNIVSRAFTELDIVASSHPTEYTPISEEDLHFSESQKGAISAYVDNGSVYLGFLSDGDFLPLSLDNPSTVFIYKSQLGIMQGERIEDETYRIEGILDSHDLSAFRRSEEQLIPFTQDNYQKQA